MEYPDFLSELNDPQREAVKYIDGPSLVIAGAGSGKTRVLTYKIAFLLMNGYHPWEIMALTFTNKAAKEMKERIGKLVGEDVARYLRMGTFHSIFARILRSEADAIGFNNNFTIYDESDSRSLCKTIVKELNLDDKTYKPAEVHRRISDAKNRLITSREYAASVAINARDMEDRMPAMAQIYSMYSQRCMMSNAMDFDDLLLNTYLLLKNHPEVLMKYQSVFRFYLVDEYQDTNYAQQQIIYLLATPSPLAVEEGRAGASLCVVGDDAQSIYGFRGANIDNILDFQKHYQGTVLFKLEQNYRSTQRIVEAANSLIHKNERQIQKNVFSCNDEGDKLLLSELSSDREEAIFVSKDIKSTVKSEGANYSDFAILYRTNSQSRTFEEQFMKDGLPYRIYGGLSFYQRKEIKDIVAYFRVIANPDDEEALKRIINYPARGIGNTTVNKIADAAISRNLSMWQVIGAVTDNMGIIGGGVDISAADVGLNKGALNKLTLFQQLIESFRLKLLNEDAYTLGKEVIRASGISQEIYSSTDPEYLSRQENLEEFLSSMNEFVESQREQGEPESLLDFLHEVALLSDKESDGEERPQITLMTVHSAKGLEFPYVYVVGMEENIFPSQMCLDSRRQLEEERRLLYVAITRAERRCTLTYAKMRYRYGNMEFQSPSRFLRDIDSRLLTFGGRRGSEQQPAYRRPQPMQPNFGVSGGTRLSGNTRSSGNTTNYVNTGNSSRVTSSVPSSGRFRAVSSASSSSSSPSSSGSCAFAIGDNVSHDRFGVGVVTSVSGDGDSTKIGVDFVNAGPKQLLIKFAKLRKL